MTIYQKNLEELNRINEKIEYVQQQLEKAPDGFLKATKRKHVIQYCHSVGDTNKYLSETDEQLIINLAIKAYHKKLYADLTNEKAALEKYVNNHKEPAVSDYLLKHKYINDLVQKGEGYISSKLRESDNFLGVKLLSDNNWVSKIARNADCYELFANHIYVDTNGDKQWNYEGDTTALYQEKRVHNTLCGVKVRSKSEVLIANELYHANVLFIYEPEMKIGDQLFHPDFVIFHPATGEVIIWEHGGKFIDCRYEEKYSSDELSNSWKYTRNFAYKIQNYISCGWIPGVNLIITSETAFVPLDIEEVDHLINKNLLDR